MQHLLLGINAHINLDLGIAAVDTVGTQPLEILKKDFHAINRILAEMIDEVQDRLGLVSPLFRILDPLAGRSDEFLAKFSIDIARDGAWRFASQLYQATPDERRKQIIDRDMAIAVIAENLANPRGKWINTVLNIVKWFESKNVVRIIDRLSRN